MKRMIQSEDSVYQIAVNLMLMRGLSNICQDYYRVRHLPWEGEKSAIRYLQIHDPELLEVIYASIAETSLTRKLSLYEQLVTQTLKPIGTLWAIGLTAVYLRNTPQSKPQLEIALQFWQDLLDSN